MTLPSSIPEGCGIEEIGGGCSPGAWCEHPPPRHGPKKPEENQPSVAKGSSPIELPENSSVESGGASGPSAMPSAPGVEAENASGFIASSMRVASSST